MIVRWLDALQFHTLVHGAAVVTIAAVVALIAGLVARRRSMTQGAVAFLVFTTSATVANTLLLLWVEPSPFDSPRVPGWSRASLVGLAVLATSAVAGAVGRRWRPWAEVWLGAAIAGGMAAGLVAWGQLDRLVIDPAAGLPRAMPLLVSPLDALSSTPRWVLGVLLGGLGAAGLPLALRGVSTRALRVAADVLGVAALLLAPAATVRGFTAPQLEGYVASLPSHEGPRREDYLPLDRVARSIAPPWSWTFAAALSVVTSILLRATRFASEPSRRTVAAMRLAVLAAGVTPLAVAAWRGFVFPW